MSGIITSKRENTVTRYTNKMRRHMENLSVTEKLLLSVIFTMLTGVAAKVRIPLPFTPVPVTLHTLIVLLSGALLGYYGVLSQSMYVIFGIVGVPWFAYGGGLSYVLSPTFGYVLGFIVASAYVARMLSKKRRGFLGTLLVLLTANFVIIYSLGVTWLYAYMNAVNSISIKEVILMGAIPFIPGDALKLIVAASFVKILKG